MGDEELMPAAGDPTPAPDAPAVAEPDPEPAEPEPEPEAAEVEAGVEAETEPDPVETAVAVADPERDSEPASADPVAPAVPESNKKWYVIKVTSNREESIKAAIERRVRIEGLEEFFGQIVIPVERTTVVKKVKETKNGEKITKEKRVVKETKKYPGYIMAEVEFNDRILYLFRETSGVGDFVGATGPLKPPPPMTDLEVRRMLGDTIEEAEDPKAKKKVVVKLDFEKGDKVRIREGAFATLEGEVKEILTPKEAGETPQVKVAAMILGRQVEVTLDYWQVDKV
jgi:transcriptional antiterminator NusG